MAIFEYMDFIRPRLKESHEKGDKEEFIRLITVLMDTLFELKRNIIKGD
jgi:hypothetical protein